MLADHTPKAGKDSESTALAHEGQVLAISICHGGQEVIARHRRAVMPLREGQITRSGCLPGDGRLRSKTCRTTGGALVHGSCMLLQTHLEVQVHALPEALLAQQRLIWTQQETEYLGGFSMAFGQPRHASMGSAVICSLTCGGAGGNHWCRAYRDVRQDRRRSGSHMRTISAPFSYLHSHSHKVQGGMSRRRNGDTCVKTEGCGRSAYTVMV